MAADVIPFPKRPPVGVVRVEPDMSNTDWLVCIATGYSGLSKVEGRFSEWWQADEAAQRIVRERGCIYDDTMRGGVA